MFVGRNEEERALAAEESAIAPLAQYPDTAERLFAGLPDHMGVSLKKAWKGAKKVGKGALRVATTPLAASASLVARVPGLKKIPGAGKVIARIQEMSDANLSAVARGITSAAATPIKAAVRKPRMATIAAVAKRRGHKKPTKADVREADKILVDTLKNWKDQNKPKEKLIRFAGRILGYTGASITGDDVRGYRASQMGVYFIMHASAVAASAAVLLAIGALLTKVMSRKAAALPPGGEGAPSEYEPEGAAEAPAEEAEEETVEEEVEGEKFHKLSVLGY